MGNQSSETKDKEEGKSTKTKYEITVDLIKALLWPLFAIFVVISFWKPLHLSMDNLPDIIGRSKTITLAGLTIEISQNLELQGQYLSPEVKSILAEMTPDDIRSLMDISGSIRYRTDNVSEGRSKFSNLIQLGVVEELPAEELTDDYGYGIRLTSLGRNTQTYLYAVISEFVHQITIAESTPSP